MNGFPSGKPMERFTGAGEHARQGTVLADDSDITRASTADLVVTFCSAMENMTRTNNTTSLANLGRYAGQLWWEMTGRGVEFR
jgi:roadblock/LC7 domain-containing protein